MEIFKEFCKGLSTIYSAQTGQISTEEAVTQLITGGIGATIGWALGGPIGGWLGYSIGNLIGDIFTDTSVELEKVNTTLTVTQFQLDQFSSHIDNITAEATDVIKETTKWFFGLFKDVDYEYKDNPEAAKAIEQAAYNLSKNFYDVVSTILNTIADPTEQAKIWEQIQSEQIANFTAAGEEAQVLADFYETLYTTYGDELQSALEESRFELESYYNNLSSYLSEFHQDQIDTLTDIYASEAESALYALQNIPAFTEEEDLEQYIQQNEEAYQNWSTYYESTYQYLESVENFINSLNEKATVLYGAAQNAYSLFTDLQHDLETISELGLNEQAIEDAKNAFQTQLQLLTYEQFGYGVSPAITFLQEFATLQPINEDVNQIINDFINTINSFALSGNYQSILDVAYNLDYLSEIAEDTGKSVEELQVSLLGIASIAKDVADKQTELSDIIAQYTMNNIEYEEYQLDKWLQDQLEWAEAFGIISDDVQLTINDMLNSTDETLRLIGEAYDAQLQDIYDNVSQTFSDLSDQVASALDSIIYSSDNYEDTLTRMNEVYEDYINLAGGIVPTQESLLETITSMSPEEATDYVNEMMNLLDTYLSLAQEVYQRPSQEYQDIYDWVVAQYGLLEDVTAQIAEEPSLLDYIEDLNDLYLQQIVYSDSLVDINSEQVEILNNIAESAEIASEALQDMAYSPVEIEGSYQSGTSYVPKTGLYLLHQGEMVIPRDSVTPLSVHINVTVNGSSNANETARAIENVIINSIRRGRLRKVLSEELRYLQ